MTINRILRGDTLIIADSSGSTVFSVKENIADGKAEFRLSGQLINEVAYELEDEINAAVSVCTELRVDMSALDFISAAGIQALIRAQKAIDETENGRMVLCGLSGQVYDVFDANGFIDMFETEGSGNI